MDHIQVMSIPEIGKKYSSVLPNIRFVWLAERDNFMLLNRVDAKWQIRGF